MDILVVDNFDSFTYNLVHYLEAINNINVSVLRNNQLSDVEITKFDALVLSPGPGLPKEAGELTSFIHMNYQRIPILGVCLGMQALAEEFGGILYNMPEVLHGRQTSIHLTTDSDPLFIGLPAELKVGRYHSWAIRLNDLPPKLKAIALDKNQFVMAMRHTEYPIYGLQFHPESVLTPQGKLLLTNWINQL